MSDFQRNSALSALKISKIGRLRNISYLCLGLVLLSSPCRAQTFPSTVTLSDRQIKELTDFYKNQSAETLSTFQMRMPKPVTDARFREAIHRNLPDEFVNRTIHDRALIAAVQLVLDPVLRTYGRAGVYDLIVVNYHAPLIMADSGVVLLISTGMIQNAESDDELLGYAAHEVAHEFFVKYSVYAKHLLQLISEGQNEPLLKRQVIELLAIVELQCDVFAALTLQFLHYSPEPFLKSLERSALKFPTHSRDFHPPETQRRRVVEQIMQSQTVAKPRQSSSLLQLKQLLTQSLNAAP